MLRVALLSHLFCSGGLYALRSSSAVVSVDGSGRVGGVVALREAVRVVPSGFEVGFVGVGGRECRERLETVAGLAFELVPQVRSFPSFRGQRNNTGLWWLSRSGRHVGFESWLERDHLTLMDFDRSIMDVAAQPFWLFWSSESRRARSHAPDFFARLSDGTGVVVDVRPAQQVRPRDAQAFEAARQACAIVGWDYRLVHEPDPVRMANVRWLAGYRHPRCLREEVAMQGLRLLDEPMPLMDAAGLGDPLATLPTQFHLLWCGLVRADLNVALSEYTMLSVVTPG